MISICYSENLPVVWVDGEDTDAAAFYVMYASYKAARTKTSCDAFVYFTPFLSNSLSVLFSSGVCPASVFAAVVVFILGSLVLLEILSAWLSAFNSSRESHRTPSLSSITPSAAQPRAPSPHYNLHPRPVTTAQGCVVVVMESINE